MVYLIIGNGPAGVSAIERIRQLDDQGKIILVSKENNPPYSRIMTPEYMTVEVEEKDLFWRGIDFYTEYNVETCLGRVVKRILPEQSMVVLDNHETLIYDQLLIAPGSRPVVPSWVNFDTKGVFTLWDKLDSEKINSHLSEVKRAVIVGGGLVGLQSARALTAQGVSVTIIEKMDRLMPVQLDETASSMLVRLVEQNGIEVLLNTEVMSLETANGGIAAVRTREKEIPADMVLFCIGIRPNLEMVSNTSLELEQGLLVNEYMQTNLENIYAAGDVAQAFCQQSGKQKLRALWPCAVQQGKVAGANMAGGRDSYKGSMAMNSFQLFGLSVLSLGQIESTDDVEEKILMYPASGSYQKLLIKEGKFLGLIFVRDIQQAGILFPKIGQFLEQGYWGSISLVEVENIQV
ncbi:NAD(P)/FAD-dependent oxidoreductase [Desulfosporosinus lacus]|uniref:Pyridine nucleotide-disulphide oxidoreductase n=1 Tax=Desulfosporosinus lacus DSM 15449 TaxID=1121420 RepID=A0A1M5ZM96_9FIRM|nr:FAD-dependent oxidoreductase [Desulfosporosinus lacus]SHI25485.1 Pyridine nucleotide-disulphide oxidoreductase [Desulfosporosinus lacus DSM 15449]